MALIHAIAARVDAIPAAAACDAGNLVRLAGRRPLRQTETTIEYGPSGDFKDSEDIEMMSTYIPRTRFQGVQAIQ